MQVTKLIKCILFLIFLGIAVQARAQSVTNIKDVKISISLNNSDLIAVFSQLEKASNFKFVYDQNDLDDKTILNSKYSNQSLYEILKDISSTAQLDFQQNGSNIMVRKEPLRQQRITIAEPVKITGTVKDEAGEELVGLTVQVKGTSYGTITDINGNFTLDIEDPDAVLIFSYIGYLTKEIKAGNQSTINVVMQADVEQLKEVVIVGYGTQVKRNLSSSITSVDAEKINPAAVNSFESGLQGIAAGVQVTTSSALAGSAVRIRVRGTSSVSANSEPLYVIDGIPQESGEISTSQPGGGVGEFNLQQAANTNVLASLNPSDIESIEVLKDASATAIYGSRGANGVVLITTKSGVVGKTKIDLNISHGISNVTNKIDLLNSEQYIQLAQKAWYNSGNDIDEFWERSGVLVDGLTREQALATDTDWVDETLQRGHVQDYNLSFSGGSDKTTFFISANLRDQETILRGNEYRRIGTRVNVDHNISDFVKIGGRMMVTNVNDQQVPTNWAGGVGNVSEMLPIWPVFKEDGTYFNLTDEHPVAGVDLRDINLRSNQFFGNWYLDFNVIEGLTFRSEFGTSLLFNNDFHFRDGGITSHGRSVASTVNGSRTSWNWKNILNYKTRLRDHNFDFLLAQDAQSFSTTTNTVIGDTFINSTLRNPQDAAIRNASSTESEYSFLSFIGRVNYDLRGKYLVSLSMRGDGSSRFADGNKWGYFPAVSVGWVLSDEPILAPLQNTFDFLKLRMSYGLVGNAEIGDYAFASTYSTLTYDGNTGLQIGNLSDDNLSWETTSQVDIGLTWEALGGRIGGEIDYYKKVTRDLLLPFPVSQMLGVGTVTRNVGSLSNEGFDFVLNTVNIRTESFSWESNFNVNYNENEVLSLGDNLIDEGLSSSGAFSSISVFPGYPVGITEAVEWMGVDPTTGQDTYLNNEGQVLLFDEVIEQYGSFDNFWNENRKPMGNPWPLFSGGIENRFTFKKFYANVLFTFATGQQFTDGYQKQLVQPFGGEKVNPATNILGAWNAPGDMATQSQLTTQNVRWPESSEFIYDTDFLRLRDFTIGYQTALPRYGISNLNVYTTLMNFWTLTNAPDFFWDPEFTGVVQSRTANNTGAGGAFKQTPQAKSIIFGLSVSF